MFWRFQRTGQTSFFIYDVYVPMILITLCWIGLAIAHFCKNAKWYVAYAPHLYSAVHKVHEVSIMYVTMASIVEFIYFEASSTQRIVSAIVCVAFNLYFLAYELYIYYDMIKYPLAEIGSSLYEYYVLHYGFFLKTIRFAEYDVEICRFRSTNHGAPNIGSDPTTIISFPSTKNVWWLSLFLSFTIHNTRKWEL